MASPAGIAGQLGFKSESTVGTPVTVDQFVPVLPGASVKADITRLDSKGIRAGRRVLTKWKAGAQRFSGSIPLELSNQPTATLLTHMFGSVSTTGAGPYTHTATPGTLTGKSLTMQLGVPDTGGTVRTFTTAGCKIPSWEIACNVDEIATLTLEVMGMTQATDTALASASYATGISPFVFTEGSLSIAGTEVATVKSMSLTANNNLTDRFFMNSATSSEPLENGMAEYGGSLTAEFEDLTAYTRYVDGTEAALVMAFDNGTDSLTITCNVRFDGETPELTDTLIEQPLPFVCLGSTDAAAITAVLVNNESSAA